MKRILAGIIAGLLIAAAGISAQEVTVEPDGRLTDFLQANGISAHAATSDWHELSSPERAALVELRADEELRARLNTLIYATLSGRLAAGDAERVSMVAAGTTWTLEPYVEE